MTQIDNRSEIARSVGTAYVWVVLYTEQRVYLQNKETK
jgi:hypothetical protein